MNTSEEFIEYYNKIDKYIRLNGDFDNQVSFAHALKMSANKNSVINRYKSDLISLGELRNAIIHTPKFTDGKTIAEPHPETLQLIISIHDNVVNPKKVIPLFQTSAFGVKKNDFINGMLANVYENSFSQFPVFVDDCVVEVINTNTISRWLSNHLEDSGSILVADVKVEDLIDYIEFSENFKFISRNTTVYEAYDIFINHTKKKKRNLDVLLITESGKSTDKLLGLITIEDIAIEIEK